MTNAPDYTEERLQRALDIYTAWRDDPGRLSPEEFLCLHEELRDALEPLLRNEPGETGDDRSGRAPQR